MGKKGMGWVPDYPDVRDCTLSDEKVKRIQSNAPEQNIRDGSDDRAQQLLKLIGLIEQTLPNHNIDHTLSNLKKEFQQEAKKKSQEIDQRLLFISANLTENFLSLGSQGKEVQDLQDKLGKLGYLSKNKDKFEFNLNILDDEDSSSFKITDCAPDEAGTFGKATESAVKAFQINQQLNQTLNQRSQPTGIYTAVTKAELLALVSITGRLGQSKYRLGVSGPGVIYVQALLKNFLQDFDLDQPLGLFNDTTLEAIKEFQKQKAQKIEKLADGIIDEKTWKLLVLDYEDRNLREKLPSAPVPKRRFERLKKQIFEIIQKIEGDGNPIKGRDQLITQLGGWEKINQSIYGSSERSACIGEPTLCEDKKLQQRLEPIIEVLIQLAPSFGGRDTLEAFEAGYKLLIRIFDRQLEQQTNVSSQSIFQSSNQEKLALLADQLDQGKGYVSSKIFRYQSYQAGVSGPAVVYIQERLRAMGYYNGPTTGYFDEQITQEAVKRFQAADQESKPPDGNFDLIDIGRLQRMSGETLIDLEPPLPNDLIDSLMADLGGLEAIMNDLETNDLETNDLEINNACETIEKIVLTLQQVTGSLDFLNLIQKAVPTNSLDASSEITLEKIAQGIKNPTKPAEEKQDLAKEFIGLIFRFILYPIAKVIAQIISPIGKYSDSKEAFKDGLRRFRVIANFSQIQTIDRILKGLIVDVLGDIDGLTQEYEPLVETLAILKAEFRQQSSLSSGFDIFEQLQTLVVVSLHSIQPVILQDANPIEQLIQQVRKWIAKQLFVEVAHYVELPTKIDQSKFKDSSVSRHSKSPTLLRRDQTFIRVDFNCDHCSLQLPVTGKMHRLFSQAAGDCSSTYLILPDAVDLSIWCSEVEDQGDLDACTAHAGVALLEYFEKKSFGNALDASRRFLYKVTRNLMHREGDTGASVRETMKAMVLFGVPPEEYCPYDEAKFDDDPSAFCYAFAQNYQTITYFRLDGAGMPARELLAQIKTILVGGFPCMFGFTVYDSIRDKTNPLGHIPYPTLDDKQEGGHAAIAVGYNDYKQIKNATNPGALLIKNSWGTDWGEGGYGWLPYDYVLNGLARDWWSLIKSEWVESKQFGLSSPDLWSANLGERLTTGTVC